MQVAPRPLLLERIALGAIFLAAIACSLIRIDVTDTPWHMATARTALATGSWPTTNTFSHSHPDYPMYQQYPLYDLLLYGTWSVAGFEGLSLLHCLVWLATLVLWIRWAGSWRWACLLALPWGIALLGLQRRMIVSADMLTMPMMVSLFLLIDRYRSGARWPCIALVAMQWVMANTHQLFPLGLAIQLTFLIHLLIARTAKGRLGLATDDVHLPVWPLVVTLVASAAVCLLTPLGTDVLDVPSHTAASVAHHVDHTAELTRVTASPYAMALLIAAGLFGFWRGRKNWMPYEIGIWVIALVLPILAIRGLAYFSALSIALFARNSLRVQQGDPWRVVRLGSAALALLIAFGLVKAFWIAPMPALFGAEAGLGKKLGSWPDEATAFLRENPPRGKMLNLGWYAGNALIWGLYPEKKVFVDPRFESYPVSLMVGSIKAIEDDALLARLLREHQINWIVAEVMLDGARQRVANLLSSGRWALVYADTIFLVLVRRVRGNAAYLTAHVLAPEQIAPTDWLTGQPALLGLQQARMINLFHDLGLSNRTEEMIARNLPLARRYAQVGRELVRFYLRRSRERLARRDYAGAMADCDALLSLDTLNAGAYYNRGHAHYQLEQLDGALADFDRAIRLDPDNASCHYNRALVRLKQGARGGAIVSFSEAIRLNPKHAEAYDERGAARDAEGDLAGAVADYQRASRLAPDRWGTWVRLAQALARSGDRRGALKALDKALPIAPPLERLRIRKWIKKMGG